MQNCLCIPIVGPNYEKAAIQFAIAQKKAQLIELRLDKLEPSSIVKITSLIQETKIPFFCIYTKNTLPLVYKFLLPHPKFLGIDYGEERNLTIPDGLPIFIHSLHIFQEIPELDLSTVWMNHRKNTVYNAIKKIAITSSSILDTLEMLLLVKKFTQTSPCIGICMGEEGAISRILAPCVGSPFTYACADLESKNAPGQLSAEEMEKLYRYSTLSAQTKIFGLIGDPITHSISHMTHNRVISSAQRDAVYVKMRVLPEELQQFMFKIQEFNIKGLSVTMPLKESILPYIDSIDHDAKKIGAVNTLKFTRGKVYGYNTDGIGAINAIESRIKVNGKHISILGGGGTAKAIAYEAKKRGALVNLFVRRESVCQKLKAQGIEAELINDSLFDCDIFIQTTPLGMDSQDLGPFPFDIGKLCSNTAVLDVVSRESATLLMKFALEKGCTTISGLDMFLEQALEQFRIWNLVDTSFAKQAFKQMYPSFGTNR